MPKILVADDNSNIQKMVANALKDQGIEVVGFSNGHTAIKKFPDVAPDMVLADVFMPVSDGYELCDWVKKSEKFSGVPVFLLVGAFDPLDEQRLAAVKADGVLKKPFVPPDNLIAAVKAMLERVSQARQAEMMERTHHDFASQVPHIEETQKLSQDEVKQLLGEKPAPAPPPPAPEPEPELHEYTARAPQIQIGESSEPAFADMLGDAAGASGEPSFRASSSAEPEAAVPSYDIKEAAKTPDPDLPPIKVDFSGSSEPLELVTDDHRSAPAPAMEHARLNELVSSTHDWTPPPPPPVAAAPPPPAPPMLEAQLPPVPTISVEPEPPPPASAPLGIPSKDLPGLEWSAPASAAPAPPPAATPPPAVTIPAAAQVNPYVVDEVVDKVMMQLQPQIVHKITTEVGKALEVLQPKVLEQLQRDIIRPLAEELLRNAAKK